MAKGQIKQAQAKIDQKMFEALCRCQCTREDIAREFDVSEDTIWRWCMNTYGVNFERIHKTLAQNGLNSLRQRSFHKALYGGKDKTGDTTMMIFMLKNLLGFSDKVENVNTEQIIINTTLPMEVTQEEQENKDDNI